MKKRDMKDLADKFKDYSPSKDELSAIENLADKYLDKTDDDLYIEIIKINNNLEEQLTEEQYQSIFKKLEDIRPLLSEEQNLKLDRVVEIIKRDKI